MGQFGTVNKKSRLSIKNPFRIELPPQLEPLLLETLVAWHRAGIALKDEVDDIFMGHVRLGINIASEYGWRARHLKHDLVGVAMVGIADAINKAPTKLVDNNITPYISATVRGMLSDFLCSQHIVSSRTLRLKLAENPMWVAPLFSSLSKWHERSFNMPMTYEIMEGVEHCVHFELNLERREFKKAVIRLRACGYSNTEIAGILDMSISAVQKLLSEVRVQYETEFPLTCRNSK